MKCTCLAEAEKALRWQALKMCLEANIADYIKEEVIQGVNIKDRAIGTGDAARGMRENSLSDGASYFRHFRSSADGLTFNG